MKQLYFLMLFVMAATGFLVGQTVPELKGEERTKMLEILSRQIARYCADMEKGMPETVRKKIAAAESSNVHSLDRECQEWVFRYARGGAEDKIWETFRKFKEIRTDDGGSILHEAFVRHVQGKPFDLAGCVDLIGLYWLENDVPDIQFAPEGRGEMKWLWKLEVPTRPHGILHVGLDTRTRRFLCFERTVGLYYPEGETLERIYAEIVQNPLAAGSHIGKGRAAKMGGSEKGTRAPANSNGRADANDTSPE